MYACDIQMTPCIFDGKLRPGFKFGACRRIEISCSGDKNAESDLLKLGAIDHFYALMTRSAYFKGASGREVFRSLVF